MDKEELEGLLKAAQKVVEAARTPECNFSTERECGFRDGTYFHHKKWCPRGRLEAAIAEYDEAHRLVCNPSVRVYALPPRPRHPGPCGCGRHGCTVCAVHQ